MDIERQKRLIYKAKRILNPDKNTDLKVVPWNMNKIKRARNWFGNNETIQGIIARQLNIKK